MADLTDAELSDLANEYNNDPQGIGYQSAIDADNYAKLANLIGQDDPAGNVVYDPIPGPALVRLMAREDILGPVKADSNDGNSATQSISEAVLRIAVPNGSLNLNRKETRDMAQALVDNGVISLTQRDKILGYAERTARREEAILGRGTDVTHANAYNALN